MSAAKKAKEMLLSKKKPPKEVGFLSTGSTLLNLAFSNKIDGGYRQGILYSFVGDSSSGKSILAASALAEASIDPTYKDYVLSYTDQEGGLLVDIKRYYGSKAAERLEVDQADSLEDFYDRIMGIGKPFAGVLDSMDALWTEKEEDKLEEDKIARGKGKETSGSYGTDKAKVNSSRLRELSNKCKDTNSIFIIISQTRDNIGFGSQFNPKTYSGGKAIKFYSRIQLWTSVREHIRKKVLGKERDVGIVSQIKITKNHITGWEGKLEIPILRNYGIDDLGSCLDWLVDEGHVKENKKVLTLEEFDMEGKKDDLISQIEEMGLEDDLRQIVGGVWNTIEEQSKVQRKSRYT